MIESYLPPIDESKFGLTKEDRKDKFIKKDVFLSYQKLLPDPQQEIWYKDVFTDPPMTKEQKLARRREDVKE